MPTQIKVEWPTCEQTGCIGIRLTHARLCLAHATEDETADALKLIGETGVIDARGVPISHVLFEQILASIQGGENTKPLIKGCQFDRATFSGQTRFSEATFSGEASFDGVAFNDDTYFDGAAFTGETKFGGATFGGRTWFSGAAFRNTARFRKAAFTGDAYFDEAAFTGDAYFDEAAFSGRAWFGDATFRGVAMFGEAAFSGQAWFDGVAFHNEAEFSEATFSRLAWFGDATFRSEAFFSQATFTSEAAFAGAAFSGNASFVAATFKDGASFVAATFSGGAWFGKAAFTSEAAFRGATFRSLASFGEATFIGEAAFDDAAFRNVTSFDRTTFRGEARFGRATFNRGAGFDRATFTGEAGFDGVTFTGEAAFRWVIFSRAAWFGGAIFKRRATFDGARFEQARQLGPLLAHRGLVLDNVEFARPVQIEVSSIGVCCRRARFTGGVQFRLRWARVALDDADLAAPSILAGIPRLASALLASQEAQIARAWRRRLAGEISERPQLLSLRRANVAGLGLSNVTAEDCLFVGAHNLDKLRLESDVSFAYAPPLLGLDDRNWGRREVIAEERAWRAERSPQWAAPGWPDWLGGQQPSEVDPAQIAKLYRALRKGREDSKDEPGAADFYYGEMEMRRHGRAVSSDGQHGAASRGRVERAILTAYWLVSGYGLRAWRAVAWLAVVSAFLAAAFHFVGFAVPPRPVSYWTSLLFAFRATLSLTDDEVKLTAWGQLLQSILRLIGPVLLGLALLALRGRVKR